MISGARTRGESVSSVDSDNPSATLKGVKGIKEDSFKGNRTIAQRTREALGNIGNRINKTAGVQGAKPGATGATMKSVNSLKNFTGGSKVLDNFALPNARPLKVAIRQDNPKKQISLLSRSNSVNQPTASGLSGSIAPRNAFKQEVKAKVFTNLQKSSSIHTRFQSENVDESNFGSKILESKQKIQPSKIGPASEDQENIISKKKIPVQDKENLCDESVTIFDKIQIKSEDKSDDTVTEAEEIKESVDPVFSSIRYLDVLDIDADDDENPLLVKEYIHDICQYLFALERKFPIRIRYLEGRLVNSRMRAVLLDWLVEVHYQFGFMPETLYMAAKTMDRYLQKERRVTRKQLQLVGVTAMYIAAKFEEVCTPTVLDFSAVSDNAFTAAEVREMEREMLTTLEYDLSPPPAIFFLRRFSKAAGVSNGRAPMMVHAMAKYIMELTVIDYSTCHFFPSEQAAASLALSMLVIDKKKHLKELWTPTLEHYSRVSFDCLKRIMTPVANVLAKNHEEPLKLKAVFNKYSRNRSSKVSVAPELIIEEWKERVLQELC